MPHLTQFTDVAAVEAWDTWFRWREGGRLHDRTIDSTWTRIADAVAASESAKAPLWANRFMDAFSQWRLLPGEQLLQAAGTGHAIDDQPPCAILNLAAFVSSPGSSSARLDLDRVTDIASLAVRLLDDAWLALADADAVPKQLRIGVIGMADALHLQNISYDSSQARQLARETAIALANGALRGSIELASERGDAGDDQSRLIDLWRARSTPASLMDDASRWGIRHSRLTAIEAQPRLSLLANNVCDALDPSIRPQSNENERTLVGGEANQLKAASAPARTLLAQAGIRAAMQPWIDAPIDYPLISLGEPSLDELSALARLADEQGLAPFAVHAGKLHAPMRSSIHSVR